MLCGENNGLRCELDQKVLSVFGTDKPPTLLLLLIVTLDVVYRITRNTMSMAHGHAFGLNSSRNVHKHMFESESL